MTRTLQLIGAPTDIGASVRGAGMGPDALRVAGLARHAARHWASSVDRRRQPGRPGHALGGAGRGAAPPRRSDRLEPLGLRRGRRRAGRRATCRCCWAATIAWRSARSARWPGTRASAAEAARAVARRAHRRQHRDHQPERQPARHAGRRACWATGPAALTGWSGERAALAHDAIRFIGIRSVDAEEKRGHPHARPAACSTCATSTSTACAPR